MANPSHSSLTRDMVILLTGASGFIGRHLTAALRARGHELVLAGRRSGQPKEGIRYVQADFTRDFEPETWKPRLAGVDAVINTVGIIREQDGQTFDAIHWRAPRALFTACLDAGVKQIIQISALGADEQAQSRYHLSKKRADDFLGTLGVPHVIVQPSLVYGADGTSATLFTRLASLPVIPQLGSGQQMVQPLHVDDLVDAMCALLDNARYRNQRVPLAGPHALRLGDFLARLRRAMGMTPTLAFPVPISLVRLGARMGQLLPGSLLDQETLQMLERGNTGDPAPLQDLIGRPSRPPERFIGAEEAPAVRRQAKLGWLLPILKLSLALVWIVTGIISFGIYPVQDSYALLAPVGITGPLAPVMLFGAAGLDLAIGLGILFLRNRTWRRWLWWLQFAVIGFYSLIIAWRLPEFLIHPYGPVLKNLPILAAIWLLMEMEDE